MSTVKTFTAQIDGALDLALTALRAELGLSSRADVFRSGIYVLTQAYKANQEGGKLVIVKQNGEHEPIPLPWRSTFEEVFDPEKRSTLRPVKSHASHQR